MAHKICCVPGCEATSEDGVPLHRFPHPDKDHDRLINWLKLINRMDLMEMDKTYLYNNRRVCRRHFEPTYLYPKNKLCRLAVPKLFMPADNYYQYFPYYQQAIEIAIVPSTSSQIPQIVSESQDCQQAIDTAVVPSTSSQIPQIVSESQDCQQAIDTAVVPSTSSQIPQIVSESQDKPKSSCQVKSDVKKERKRTKSRIENSNNFKTIVQDLPKPARIFFKMQLTNANKKKKGRKFTLNEKILALSLYKPSPKAYRLLSTFCVLPSRRTLQTLLATITLKPGINSRIMNSLKKRVEKMSENHKYCALLFDEMAISPGLTYNSKMDKVVGFVDNGTETKPRLSNHVLVFMIRGLVRKFKQPIAFSYCAGTTSTIDIKAQIKNIITALSETGLTVIATICDQGTTNLAAINSLINDTKGDYFRLNKEFRGGFFEVNNLKIIPLYDPPHLMKGIRNNMITKNVQYEMDGKRKTAKWAHIVELYQRSPGYGGMKLVPKLTAHHVMPELIPKMKVKHCTQVFSRSVGVALGFLADSGVISEESRDTADLIIMFDNLFDSVNGSAGCVKEGKKYKLPVTPRSLHHQLWSDSLLILKSMKFIKNGKEGVVPSIKSWIKTIEAFHLICNEMQAKGINSLLLRNFNQDPLENFFGAIRAHGYANIMPTASAFEAAYKTLLLNNLHSVHSVGFNCEQDRGKGLESLKSFFDDENEINTSHNIVQEIDFEDLNLPVISTDQLIQGRSRDKIEKSAAVGYCSGWIARSSKKIYKNCVNCKNDLESTEESFHKFIKLKEYENKGWLCYPSRPLFDFFAQVEQVTTEIMKTKCHTDGILNYVKLVVTVNISLNFVTCSIHADKLKDYLIHKSINFFIYNWCKDVNSILSGKLVFWDKSDQIKNAAREMYSKSKGRKRKLRS